MGKIPSRLTSKSPSNRTAINVSSFFDSVGLRMAALTFCSAFENIFCARCRSSFRFCGLPERTRATDEVARESGESGVVFWYKGNRCSR